MSGVVTLVLLLACACGSAQHPRSTEPDIVLLSPGAEPRQQLRYEPALGDPERLEVDYKLHLASEYVNTVLETGQVSTDFPTVRRTLRLQAARVPGSDDVEVTCAGEAVAVLDDVIDPKLRARVEALALQTRDIRGSWRLSPSGRVSAVTFEPPPNASHAVREQVAKLRELIELGTLIYPEQPIGIGASWRVTRQVQQANATWTTTATYTLRERSATSATVEGELSATASSQVLRAEPNRSVRLTSGKGHARGNFIIPLHGIATTQDMTSLFEFRVLIVERHLRITSTTTLDTLIVARRLSDSP